MSFSQSEAKKEYWRNMPLGKKAELSAKISATLKAGYENMTPEGKADFCAKRKKALTPEVRKRIAQRVSVYLQSNPVAIENLRVKGGRASRKYHQTKSQEEKERRALAISKGVTRQWASYPEEVRKLIIGKMAVRVKEWWAHFSPEDKLKEIEKRVLPSRLACSNKRPTSPELAVWGYLDGKFPGEWRYNGYGSEGVIIGSKIPDFVNINGKKSVLEVFGSYWHQDNEVEPLKAHYAKYGFSCIIVWDYECSSEESLDKILREVLNNG